jgi:hypothetical protein
MLGIAWVLLADHGRWDGLRLTAYGVSIHVICAFSRMPRLAEDLAPLVRK